MEFFRGARAVRLKGQHNGYLIAGDDDETVRQSGNGSSRNARWIVEFVEGKKNAIRLRSCHRKYLCASDDAFLLGWTGKKVLQVSPSMKTDPSVEWEPLKDGASVKLRSWEGMFLRANGWMMPPWKNSVTHDSPQLTATQDWILWRVDVLEIDHSSSEEVPKELPDQGQDLSQKDEVKADKKVEEEEEEEEADDDDVESSVSSSSPNWSGGYVSASPVSVTSAPTYKQLNKLCEVSGSASSEGDTVLSTDRINMTSESSLESGNRIIRAMRTIQPMHLTFEVQAYQELVELYDQAARYESIISTQFNVGHHSWALVIYPKGKGVHDHISLYVKLLDKIRDGECVHASFKFFVLNNETEKYITIQDTGTRSFTAGHREWGISEAISAKDFFDKSNGLLVNDSCTFGVEVYVVDQTLIKTLRLSMMEKQTHRSYTWPIYDLSTIRPSVFSPTFKIEDRAWKLQVYPRGNLTGQGKYLSLYFYLIDRTNLIGGKRLYVDVQLNLKDQLTGEDHEKNVGFWFDSEKDHGGLDDFIELAELNNPTKGYRLDDRVMIEAAINHMFILQQIC
ncbi:hypothetical protein Ancab_039348 [Ancistrocladus abbreviatus]